VGDFIAPWLEAAEWLTRRWWTKPLGWVLYGFYGLFAGVAGLVVVVILVGGGGLVIYGVAMQTTHSNGLSATLFTAVLLVGLFAAFASWREEKWLGSESSRWRAWERASAGSATFAVTLGIAWLATIPGFLFDSGASHERRGDRA
jgi:hypothetical protein